MHRWGEAPAGQADARQEGAPPRPPPCQLVTERRVHRGPGQTQPVLQDTLCLPPSSPSPDGRHVASCAAVVPAGTCSGLAFRRREVFIRVKLRSSVISFVGRVLVITSKQSPPYPRSPGFPALPSRSFAVSCFMFQTAVGAELIPAKGVSCTPGFALWRAAARRSQRRVRGTIFARRAAWPFCGRRDNGTYVSIPELLTLFH